MRWKFVDAKDQKEAAKRQAIEAKIDDWWAAFQGRTKAIDDLFNGRKKWDLPSWMEKHLQGIHPQLMWEYGPEEAITGHRLVITPESEKHLRPLVERILEKAPKVKGWRFYPYRQPESVEMAKASVEGRAQQDITGATALVSVGDHRRIDVQYVPPAGSDLDDGEARNGAFVALESLLGEEVLDKWIGAIEVGKPPKKARTIPLERLRETVAALMQSLIDQLPERPCFEWIADAEWSSFELKPEEQHDYYARADLIAAVSGRSEVFECVHSGFDFYSCRFSRCDERFCYLKVDAAQIPWEKRVQERQRIEDLLIETLGSRRLGGVVGGGTGIRYLYTDLALLDMPKSIACLRRFAEESELPSRSWLLFFDCEWEREWVGLRADSPRPPKRPAE